MTEICNLHHCDENQFILNEARNKALPFGQEQQHCSAISCTFVKL